MAPSLHSSASLCRDPLSVASFAADVPGAEDSVLASSRAAAVAYYAAVDKFRRSTSPSALEEAMVAIEAAQITEKDARAKDLTQVIAIMARCDVLVEQKPEPAAWWAVVGTRVEMEGAEATLSETGGWGDERRARYADLLQVAQIKVDEGLLIDNPWLNMLWAEIVALLVDDDGADGREHDKLLEKHADRAPTVARSAARDNERAARAPRAYVGKCVHVASRHTQCPDLLLEERHIQLL